MGFTRDTRSPGHYIEWINEIKGSKERAMSNFDYAGPLNEAVLLGKVAILSGKKLLLDNNNMKVSNVSGKVWFRNLKIQKL
jgi:hypothetical protein